MLHIEAIKRSNSSRDNVIITTVLSNGPKFLSNGYTVYVVHITFVIALLSCLAQIDIKLLVRHVGKTV